MQSRTSQTLRSFLQPQKAKFSRKPILHKYSPHHTDNYRGPHFIDTKLFIPSSKKVVENEPLNGSYSDNIKYRSAQHKQKLIMFYYNTLAKLEKVNLDFHSTRSFTVTNRAIDLDASILRDQLIDTFDKEVFGKIVLFDRLIE